MNDYIVPNVFQDKECARSWHITKNTRQKLHAQTLVVRNYSSSVFRDVKYKIDGNGQFFVSLFLYQGLTKPNVN